MSNGLTWKELKALVDERLEDEGLEDSKVVVDYIDISGAYMHDGKVRVGGGGTMDIFVTRRYDGGELSIQ